MKKIAKDVNQISVLPRNSINCYVVDDLLIDAGIKRSSRKILKAIEGHALTAHVLTHAHADHQGSSSVICSARNIPLWTSVLEKENAESGKVIFEYPNSKHPVARFQQKYWAGDGHPVDKVLREGDQVGSFTVIETPGHSKGHISFFREKDGVLIVGDTLVNMNMLSTFPGLHEPPGLFTSDRELNRQSIRKLYDLSPRILCFGHGPVLYNTHEFKRFMDRM